MHFSVCIPRAAVFVASVRDAFVVKLQQALFHQRLRFEEELLVYVSEDVSNNLSLISDGVLVALQSRMETLVDLLQLTMGGADFDDR